MTCPHDDDPGHCFLCSLSEDTTAEPGPTVFMREDEYQPTQWAYEQACKALEKAKAERDALRARVATLEGALEDVRTAILTAPPDLITDTLWLAPAMTVVDCIDAALSRPADKDGGR